MESRIVQYSSILYPFTEKEGWDNGEFLLKEVIIGGLIIGGLGLHPQKKTYHDDERSPWG